MAGPTFGAIVIAHARPFVLPLVTAAIAFVVIAIPGHVSPSPGINWKCADDNIREIRSPDILGLSDIEAADEF